MNWSGKRVLVTGADGFIGSHLAEELVRRGAKVRALVMYNARGGRGWLDQASQNRIDGMEVVAGDIRDRGHMQQTVLGCHYVFHLAALIGIPYSYVAPQSYVDTNVTGTLNLLEAARTVGVERMVLTSTSEVYGTAQRVPMDESHPLQAQSPYAASKIGADQLGLAYHRSFDLPVSIVRPFNTYGPRQSLRAVIPTVILQVLAGARSVELGSTAPTRDFNHVSDVVAGFLAIGAAANAVGEVFNLGSGFEISIGDTVQLIGEALGRELEVRQDPARVRPQASEVERLYAATDKVRRACGWVPEFAGKDGFRRGLAQTCAWFAAEENRDSYRLAGYAV